jgi:hypothetical protein
MDGSGLAEPKMAARMKISNWFSLALSFSGSRFPPPERKEIRRPQYCFSGTDADVAGADPLNPAWTPIHSVVLN